VWYQNIRSASFSFVTMHACDRQTDRIMTPKTALAYARMVKIQDPLKALGQMWWPLKFINWSTFYNINTCTAGWSWHGMVFDILITNSL